MTFPPTVATRIEYPMRWIKPILIIATVDAAIVLCAVRGKISALVVVLLIAAWLFTKLDRPDTSE